MARDPWQASGDALAVFNDVAEHKSKAAGGNLLAAVGPVPSSLSLDAQLVLPVARGRYWLAETIYSESAEKVSHLTY